MLLALCRWHVGSYFRIAKEPQRLALQRRQPANVAAIALKGSRDYFLGELLALGFN